ncbi:MAG: hypothetical protein ACFB21_08835 [Opitutales bacterium]
MERSAVKELIEQKLSEAGISFTEAAVERLLDPRYLRDEALAEFDDKENRAGVEKIAELAIKRYRKRASRSKADAVTLREIDSRTVARDAFGAFAPYKLPAPPKPEPESESEENAENSPEEAAAE